MTNLFTGLAVTATFWLGFYLCAQYLYLYWTQNDALIQYAEYMILSDNVTDHQKSMKYWPKETMRSDELHLQGLQIFHVGNCSTWLEEGSLRNIQCIDNVKNYDGSVWNYTFTQLL